MAALRLLLTLSLGMALGGAAAVCVPAGVGEAAEPAAGLSQARHYVAALEPVLPPITPGAAGRGPSEARAWFVDRALLPDQAPETRADEVWRRLGPRLAEHYQVAWHAPAGPHAGGWRFELAHWLLDAAETIRPAALLATDVDDPDRLAFVGVIWPSPVYPRLIVRRPPEEPVLGDGLAAYLETLGTCAVEVENWIRAPADVALDLFVQENRTRMAVVATEPETDGGVTWIPQGEEVAAFRFEVPALREVERYAAVFQGPSPGPVAIARLLPRVRTNMGLGDIRALLAQSGAE